MPELDAQVFSRVRAARDAARQVEWKFDLYPEQREIVEDLHRRRIVVCGRRFGKSFLASHEAVDEANAAEATVILAAPTYKTAKLGVWSYLVNNLEPRFRKVHEGDLVLELKGGGRVVVGSLDQADNLRGAGSGLCGIIIEEAAMVPDYPVENVLLPMLLDCRGWLLAISTPKGRRGYFYRYAMRGLSNDPKDATYKTWQMPTWVNPTLPDIDEQIDELRNSMPENVFRQEIGAEFVDDVGAVFRDVQLAELAERQVDRKGMPRLVAGADYFVGIDFARSGQDYTFPIVLMKLPDGDLRLVWMDRWGRIADEEQIDRLAAILLHFRPRRTLAEANSFGAVYCAWMHSKHGITVELFETSGSSKGPLILQAAAAFEFHRVEIWPHTDPLGGVLVNELLSYERGVTSHDNPTYSAPVGFHDDGVMALAMAIRAADGEPDGTELSDGFESDLEQYIVRPSTGSGPAGGWLGKAKDWVRQRGIWVMPERRGLAVAA